MSSATKHYVLHVEDDFDSRRKKSRFLISMGFGVVAAHRAADARELFLDYAWALVVIHLGDEQNESLELCRWIKSQHGAPVLMLTDRSEIVTEEMALLAGADDYAVRPVNKAIFAARLGLLSPRSLVTTEAHEGVLTWGALQTVGSPATSQASAVLAVPGSSSYMSLDLDQHQFFVGKTEISLTKSEFVIMRILMENQRQVLTRGQLLDALGIRSDQGSDQVIDAHISRLRNKIRRECGEDVLKAVHGIGFRLVAAVYVVRPVSLVPVPGPLDPLWSI